MVVDTSAVVAILGDEPERAEFSRLIAEAGTCLISAATMVELSIVLEARYGEEGTRVLDLLISKAGIEVVAVDQKQALVARRAYRAFGKGRHPASLNFGDCFSYALAWVMEQPLLFKGDDFAATDILPVSTG